jgi:hypothetical protein
VYFPHLISVPFYTCLSHRILFAAGETSSDETTMLAPGESKQFAMGAKKGQLSLCFARLCLFIW